VRLPLPLFELDLRVGLTLRRVTRPNGLRRLDHDFAFARQAVGAFDGAEAGGYAGFAGGDGLAVLPAVGALGEGLAEALDFADVGFSFAGVGGDGVHGDVGGGGVEDEADGAGLGVTAGEGENLGTVGFRPGLFRGGVALPGSVAECGQHDVGSVDLVAGGQPPGCDMVDGTVPAIGCSQTVLDQALVQGKVGKRAVLRKAVGPSCPGSGAAVFGMVHACWVWLISQLLPGPAVGWRVPAGG
jgi:hypothetical protein